MRVITQEELRKYKKVTFFDDLPPSSSNLYNSDLVLREHKSTLYNKKIYTVIKDRYPNTAGCYCTIEEKGYKPKEFFTDLDLTIQ